MYCRIDVRPSPYAVFAQKIMCKFTAELSNGPKIDEDYWDVLEYHQSDDNCTEPVEYFIDYIRLYQNEDGKLYHIGEDKKLCEITDRYALPEFKK